MKTVLFALLLTGIGQSQPVSLPLPSPDQILRIQDAEARDRAMAARTYQRHPEPVPAAVPAPASSPLTEAGRRELREALDGFFREHPGVIIDARTGCPIEHLTPSGGAGRTPR